MSTALVLGLVLVGQPKAEAPRPPLALLGAVEVDDIDRAIRRRHDAALLKRAQLESSARLAKRGLVSDADIRRETADVQGEEAREAELEALRALKAHERDVLAGSAPADADKALGLMTEWLKKREAVARIDLDYREYELEKARALFQRKAVGRRTLEDAALAENAARAEVALCQSRRAEVAMEQAAPRGERPHDPAGFRRRKSEYLKARLHYSDVVEAGAKGRLEAANDRARQGLIPAEDLPRFRKDLEEADAALAADRQALDRHETETPPKDEKAK
jgi:hypothetical protein